MIVQKAIWFSAQQKQWQYKFFGELSLWNQLKTIFTSFTFPTVLLSHSSSTIISLSWPCRLFLPLTVIGWGVWSHLSILSESRSSSSKEETLEVSLLSTWSKSQCWSPSLFECVCMVGGAGEVSRLSEGGRRLTELRSLWESAPVCHTPTQTQEVIHFSP